MCTYNGEKYLKEQLDSIINQTHQVHEIIICDDLSNDRTLAILNNYQQKFPTIIKIYKNEITLKSVKNFEKAISLTTGDIVFLADQDDIWVLNKVEDYKNYFQENPRIQVIASNGYCIDDKSKVHEKHSLWDIPQFLREIGVEIDYLKLITYSSNIATGATMAFKRTIIPEIIPFPEIDGFHHDEWIAIIASYKKSFELINGKYLYYRIHDKQQVGGVFFEKNSKQKAKLIKNYNLIDNSLKNFNYLKKKLKILIEIYDKNTKFLFFNTNHNELFKKNLKDIKKQYFETATLLEKKYPFHYFILKKIDKLRNKRKPNFN